MSILAGIMIAVGATCYLLVGGLPGAVLFGVGLMAVLTFKMYLFTGQAGKVPTREVSWWRLIKTWFGNFYGCWLVATLFCFTPLGIKLAVAAEVIVATRLATPAIANLIYGMFCGLLMYCAVAGYEAKGSWLSAIFPVATFIMCGFAHCVADMFYLIVGGATFVQLAWVIVPVTLGNIIGCCVIPLIKKLPR